MKPVNPCTSMPKGIPVLGRKIFQDMSARYITQAELAARMGTSVENVKRFQRKEVTHIGRKLFPKLAAALGMDLKLAEGEYLVLTRPSLSGPATEAPASPIAAVHGDSTPAEPSLLSPPLAAVGDGSPNFRRESLSRLTAAQLLNIWQDAKDIWEQKTATLTTPAQQKSFAETMLSAPPKSEAQPTAPRHEPKVETPHKKRKVK